MFTTFYIVRHGEAVSNAAGLSTGGENDSPLNDKGRAQTAELATALRDIYFDEIFSSDLVRAKHTAEIVALERKLAVRASKLIRERRIGKYSGKPWQKFHDDFHKELASYQTLTEREKWEHKLSDDMESEAEVASRLITFLRETALAHSGKTILVVAHGGIIRSLLMHLGWAPIGTLKPGMVKNTGYIKVRTDGVDFFLDEVNGVTKP